MLSTNTVNFVSQTPRGQNETKTKIYSFFSRAYHQNTNSSDRLQSVLCCTVTYIRQSLLVFFTYVDISIFRRKLVYYWFKGFFSMALVVRFQQPPTLL